MGLVTRQDEHAAPLQAMFIFPIDQEKQTSRQPVGSRHVQKKGSV
jgi:hypothetical protein